jgi:hypothetical protein
MFRLTPGGRTEVNARYLIRTEAAERFARLSEQKRVNPKPSTSSLSTLAPDVAGSNPVTHPNYHLQYFEQLRIV